MEQCFRLVCSFSVSGFLFWEGVLKLQLQNQSPQTKLSHVKSSKCCHWNMVINVSLSGIFRTPRGPASEMPRMLFSSIFSSTCGKWQAAWMILGYICKDIQCVSQNILPTWNKAIWGWLWMIPLTNHDSSEVTLICPDIIFRNILYIELYVYICISGTVCVYIICSL